MVGEGPRPVNRRISPAGTAGPHDRCCGTATPPHTLHCTAEPEPVEIRPSLGGTGRATSTPQEVAHDSDAQSDGSRGDPALRDLPRVRGGGDGPGRARGHLPGDGAPPEPPARACPPSRLARQGRPVVLAAA